MYVLFEKILNKHSTERPGQVTMDCFFEASTSAKKSGVLSCATKSKSAATKSTAISAATKSATTSFAKTSATTKSNATSYTTATATTKSPASRLTADTVKVTTTEINLELEEMTSAGWEDNSQDKDEFPAVENKIADI